MDSSNKKTNSKEQLVDFKLEDLEFIYEPSDVSSNSDENGMSDISDSSEINDQEVNESNPGISENEGGAEETQPSESSDDNSQGSDGSQSPDGNSQESGDAQSSDDNSQESGDAQSSDGNSQESGDAQSSDGNSQESEDAQSSDGNSQESEDAKSSDDNSQEDPNKPDGSKKEEDPNKPDGSKKEENSNKPDGSKKEEEKNKPDGSKKEEDPNKPDGSKKEEDPNKPDGSKKEEEKNKPDGSKKEEEKNKPDGSKKEEDPNKPDGSKKEEDPNKPDGSKKEEEKNKNNDSGGKDSQKKSPRENKNKKLSENNSLKDRLKNGAKNRAKNAVNNNKAGQTVNDLKDKTEKIKKAANVAKKAAKATAKALKITAKAISAIVKAAMAAWPVTLTIIIIIIICAAFTALTPGLHGDVKENTDSYSKTDRKTLEKLKALFNKYPKADGALAIATVIYPYYDMLWDQEVGSMVLNPSDSNKEESTLEDPEEDLEEIKEEKDEQVDDVYLELFRKWQYRSRLKTLLKKFDAEGEEAYFSYLKTSYFNGNGYDDLINKVKDDKKEDLKNRIIENLKNIKGNFLNYVSENVSCSVSLTSVGTAEIDSMLKSSVFVDVKERSCKTGTKTGINACKSMYEAPISLKNYVMGVTYQEIGVNENTSIEKVKAQMIAAKGFAVSRYKIMGWGLQQTAEGAYVIPIRSNTNDQDYCDLDTGCMDNPSGNHRGPVSTMVRQMLDQAWNETVNDYVYDKDKAITVGAYKNKHDDSCLLGSCLAQTELDQNVENKMTYMEILASQYKNYAMVNIETGNLSVPGEKVCTESGNTNDSRQKVVNTAMGVIGKIPYYFGGKPDVAGYEGNAFGTVLTIPDSGGRLLKGLDCSGFVNWVFWTTMNDNLGNGSTNDLLAISEEIVYEDLKPGDLGFINDGSDGDNHVGIYAGENKWIHETGGEINNVTYGTYTGFKLYKRLNILKSNDFSGWTVREKTPISDGLFEKGNTANRGQCVWYAKNRAKEIMESLYTSGDMDKAMYDKLYQKVDISYGNGGDWFDRYKEIYKSSSNVEDAKPGSFITWGSAGCFGHIAVVEQVNKEKNEIVITEGYAKDGISCPGNWNCVKFKKFNREMKTNALKYRATCGNGGGKVNLNFQGYLYFLEE